MQQHEARRLVGARPPEAIFELAVAKLEAAGIGEAVHSSLPAQFEALDLARRRLRQRIDDGDPARIFPNADADLEHVVRAPAISVATVGVARIFVAGARPLALEGRAALLALIPIAVARR